jgi:WD40 repeat protein
MTIKKKVMRPTDLFEDEHDPEEIRRKVNLKYVYDGFHNGSINSMSICKHRPFIVTCSQEDSTIRIWNYLNYKCELARKFYVGAGEDSQGNIKPLSCVALHPNGYYMAVAFINKLRFYHIL